MTAAVRPGPATAALPICFLTDNLNHPTLRAASEQLGRRRPVAVLDPADAEAGESHLAGARLAGRWPVHLLKSHTPAALRLATELEDRGAVVVNPARATALCRDRWLLSEALAGADAPVPAWITAPSLAALAPRLTGGAAGSTGWVIKSRFSRRRELVERVDAADVARLAQLLVEWADEPVLAQALVPNDGWDVKLWVFGDEVLTARRRTALEDGHRATTAAWPGTPPPAWLDITRRIGRSLGLLVYGVDLVIGPDGPVVVDVNAFPGARGIAGSAASLARLVERLANA